MEPMRAAAIPTPIRARPRAKTAKLCARPKTTLPRAATRRRAGVTARGPTRSKSPPRGSWAAAKAR